MMELTKRERQIFILGLTAAFSVVREACTCEQGPTAMGKYVTSMYGALGIVLDDPEVEKEIAECLGDLIQEGLHL